jgi:hypothetical protein
MKKRIISVILIIVVICSLTITAYADACNHDFDFKYDALEYVYYDDEQCTRYHVDYYQCSICSAYLRFEYYDGIYAHSFGPYIFVGYTAGGLEWWYRDCVNCGTRIDYFQ